MNKALDDELTFVLLGRDPSSPMAIRMWVADRIRREKNTWHDQQIVEALACAKEMENRRSEATEREVTCAEKLEKAFELLFRVEEAPDPTWWKEVFLLAGEHMILTDEGWEGGEAKQSYLDDLDNGGADAILDEVNAPEVNAPGETIVARGKL